MITLQLVEVALFNNNLLSIKSVDGFWQNKKR